MLPVWALWVCGIVGLIVAVGSFGFVAMAFADAEGRGGGDLGYAAIVVFIIAVAVVLYAVGAAAWRFFFT